MYTTQVTMSVRKAGDQAKIIDVRGRVTSLAENTLMDAFTQASTDGAPIVVLNLTDLEYMNSSGIGLLIRLFKQADTDGRGLLAFGLNEYYQNIFELTGLNKFIRVYETEADALAAVGQGGPDSS
jgi:anti-anti-sigma factor